MPKRTKSILEEINGFVPEHKKSELIETKANHVIASATYILDMITESFDDEEAATLTRRFLSSIKTGDPEKFTRCLSRIENARSNNDGKL